MIKQYFILIFLLLVINSDSSARNYELGDTLIVAAINGLNLRKAPNLNSEKLGLMKSGSNIIVLQTFGFQKNDTINNLFGNWILVQFDSIQGFAFDGYLSNFPFAKLKDSDDFCNLVGHLSEYAKTKLGTIKDSVNYDNEGDGDGSQKIEIFNLTNGSQILEQVFWESYRFELKLINVRDSEVYNLMNQISINCQNENPKIKNDFDKIKKIGSSIFINKIDEVESFTINIRRSHLKNVFITIEGGP